jgi:hypothetical protein
MPSFLRVGLWHQLIQHAVQMRGCELDLDVFVLAGTGFSGEDRATVHILEVAVGKLVAALVVRGDFVILGEMPSARTLPSRVPR